VAEALLAARELTFHFGGLVAVDRVSLDLRRSEIHALIGTNGAGKSTLINLLAGELAASSGTITFRNQPVARPRPQRMARLGIGRTFQRSNVFAELSAFENCRLAAQASRPRAWAVHESAQRCEASTAAAMNVLDTVGLSARSRVAAGELSHGERRGLEIAMCLATDPQVLLLDEPLAGMGAEESQQVLGVLRSLKAERAILLVEHDMDAVFAVADVITVMADGSVLASGPPERVRRDEAVRAAYLGETI